MKISNKLIESSFEYNGISIDEKENEIYDLSDIVDYCNQIGEYRQNRIIDKEEKV